MIWAKGKLVPEAVSNSREGVFSTPLQPTVFELNREHIRDIDGQIEKLNTEIDDVKRDLEEVRYRLLESSDQYEPERLQENKEKRASRYTERTRLIAERLRLRELRASYLDGAPLSQPIPDSGRPQTALSAITLSPRQPLPPFTFLLVAAHMEQRTVIGSEIPEWRDGGLIASASAINFITLKSEWLNGSGIGKFIADEGQNQRVVDTLLYIRQVCLDQMKFMTDLVLKKCAIGLINGQPGTGKSITAYLKALMFAVHCNIVILWVHIAKTSHGVTSFQCVLMRGNTVSSFPVMCKESVSTLILSNWTVVDDKAQRILFLDGFVSSETQQPSSPISRVADAAKAWYEHNRELHGLFVLSSMDSVSFLKKEARMYTRERRFTQWSWTKPEYNAAMNNEEFRRSVATQLVPPGQQGDPVIVKTLTSVWDRSEQEIPFSASVNAFTSVCCIKAVSSSLITSSVVK